MDGMIIDVYLWILAVVVKILLKIHNTRDFSHVINVLYQYEQSIWKHTFLVETLKHDVNVCISTYLHSMLKYSNIRS